MTTLRLIDGGLESPLTTFERDHLAICEVASGRRPATVRMWRSESECISLGRYHRRPRSADVVGHCAMVRRLTGGRAFNVGPEILSATMVFPALSWLDRGRGELSPDQVLNRALRPWLAALREMGVDAFYGGRDVVTWARQPIAVASFTVLPDGIVVVDVHVAVDASFARTEVLLASCDPLGIVPFDSTPFRDARPLSERGSSLADARWVEAVARRAGEAFRCDVEQEAFTRAEDPGARPTYDAFQNERGEIMEGWRSALGVEMLGAVEVAARVDGGRIVALEVTGDVIAPFGTLEELGDACCGEPPTRAAAERALLTVLTRPGRFVLGVRDFAALVERLS